jgi:hypothetical protein
LSSGLTFLDLDTAKPFQISVARNPTDVPVCAHERNSRFISRSFRFLVRFTRAIYDACGSKANAKTAFLTLVDCLSKIDKAGAFGPDHSKEDINAALNALSADPGQTEKTRDFVQGADDGTICVNLVVGTNTYDQDHRVQDARRLNDAVGGPCEGIVGSFLQLTIKRKYKERYGVC